MAFVAANLRCFSAGASANLFVYSTGDAHNTVFAYNYFSSLYYNFRVGDQILLACSAGASSLWMAVSEVAATGVTVIRET
jgi:hypothetical protein